MLDDFVADWESVRAARAEFQRANAENAKVLRPLIEDYLRAYEAVLGELDEAHVLITETEAFDLLGPSREAARWLLTGRCIGLARAGLDLVRLGYSSEMAPILRSLHEATRLLGVVCHKGEDDLVDRWIRGRHVSRREIMHAADRQEQRIRVEMIRAGERPVAPTKSFFDGQHGRWSEFAHHRRRHIADQVAAPDRVMVKGPHPDWRVRACAADHYGDSLLELVVVGGSAVSQTLGPQWHYRFQRTIASFTELKAKVPLADVATGRAHSAAAQGS
jgi:Family of unknown function (DUF5677)